MKGSREQDHNSLTGLVNEHRPRTRPTSTHPGAVVATLRAEGRASYGEFVPRLVVVGVLLLAFIWVRAYLRPVATRWGEKSWSEHRRTRGEREPALMSRIRKVVNDPEAASRINLQEVKAAAAGSGFVRHHVLPNDGILLITHNHCAIALNRIAVDELAQACQQVQEKG